LMLEDDSTASTTTSTIVEMGHAYSRMITPLSGSKSEVVLKRGFTHKKYFRADPFSAGAQVAVTSDPTELACFILSLTAFNSATITIDFDVTIIYDIYWTELKTVTQS